MISIRISMMTVLLIFCNNIVCVNSIGVVADEDTTGLSPVILIEDISKNFLDDGFNLLGVIGFFLGLASLYFAKVTFDAQRQTELHTTNAPKSAQIGKLKDLSRHFYRNLVCTCAMTLKYLDNSNKNNGVRINYPSESNVLKLKTLPDEIIYDIDEEEKSYAIRHEFKLLLRNFNTEVDVASEHFSRINISDDAISQDIDNIIFKQLFLLCRSYDILLSLDKVSLPEAVADSLHIILKEHFTKLKENKIIDKENQFMCHVNRILNDTNKLNKFKESIDPKGSLYRSYDIIPGLMADYYSDKNRDGEKRDFDEILFAEETDKNGKKKIEIIVDRQKFVDSIRNEGNDKSRMLADFIDKISSITEFEKFREVFYNEGLGEKDYKNVYEDIYGYFKFISQDKWMFRDLLLVIVTMDCTLETKKVGMVNFTSL